jgi:ribonuclease P/MRP protein subunit RPP40
MAVANGFNQEKPPTLTGLVTLDISKAFDSVDHTVLLKQLSDSAIDLNVMRWLAVYICGRSASCLFSSSVSTSRIIHSGIPQGSVLSPSHFNFFISDFLLQASVTATFADDFNLAESAPDLPSITSALNDDLRLVEA